MSRQRIEWDQALIEKYNSSGPRYTSYPTALEFHEQFTESDFQQQVTRYPTRPLSLYFHLPFCQQLCYFCACNKIVTRHQHKAEQYLIDLTQEILLRAPLFTERTVSQIHFGGGTPTFLTDHQLAELMALIRRHFRISPKAEISLELDPRGVTSERLVTLKNLGINRLSMGVQDFNPVVQQRVNRLQDEEHIFSLMAEMKSLGFISGNIDLIYGLPQQTVESFGYTVERILALRPDRLSVFNYAHMPRMFAAQRKIKTEELPTPAAKLQILQNTVQQLQDGGYQFIGMDHFALPEDELAQAQAAGKLQRNFQGYTTQQETDLLGLGVSAISIIGDSYAQNHKTLSTWRTSLAQKSSGLARGMNLSVEDRVRREIIKNLMCQFTVRFASIEAMLPQPFERYFSAEIALLAPMMIDGLVEITERTLKVTARGRLLIRHICYCFDQYSRQRHELSQFSRVI